MSFPAIASLSSALNAIHRAKSIICVPIGNGGGSGASVPSPGSPGANVPSSGPQIYSDSGNFGQYPYNVGPADGQLTVLPYNYNLEIDPNGYAFPIGPYGTNVPFVLDTDGSVLRNELNLGPLGIETGILNWDINAANDLSEGLYLVGDANVAQTTYSLGPAQFQVSALGVQSNSGLDYDQGVGLDVSAYIFNAELSASNLGTSNIDSSSSAAVSLGVGAGSPVSLEWGDADNDGYREYGGTLQLPIKPGFDLQVGYSGEDPLRDVLTSQTPGLNYILPGGNLTHTVGDGVVATWDTGFEVGRDTVGAVGDGVSDGVGWVADHNPLPWP